MTASLLRPRQLYCRVPLFHRTVSSADRKKASSLGARRRSGAWRTRSLGVQPLSLLINLAAFYRRSIRFKGHCNDGDVASFLSTGAAGRSRPLIDSAFLPKGAWPSSPLASAPAVCAAPRSFGVEHQDLTATLLPFGLSAGIEAAIDAGSKPKRSNMSDVRNYRIHDLNDAFRTTLSGGKAFFSTGVSALGADFGVVALAAVRCFADFSLDNDPYGEHDFGAFTVGNEALCWKIDYYDPSLDFGSKDPADPAQTTRVLTIMLVEEY